jgi:hypothetical protein
VTTSFWHTTPREKAGSDGPHFAELLELRPPHDYSQPKSRIAF